MGDMEVMVGEGLKYDSGKAQWHLLPMSLVRKCADVLTYGAKKYGPNNWQKLENAEERYYDALIRHVVAWHEGEELDQESGISHLAHAMCNLVFLDWLYENEART